MNNIDLHKIIDNLPESKLPVVRAYLEGIRDGLSTRSVFDSASYDEYEYSKQELLIIDERIQEAQGGQTISFDQVKAEHGLT